MFIIIKKEALLLYDSGSFSFPEVDFPTREFLIKQGENFFERWYKMAIAFYNNAHYNFDRGEFRMTAFMLHQALKISILLFIWHLLVIDPPYIIWQN